MRLTRIKVLTGYTAHARFLAECSEEPIGYVATESLIPSPYAYSPTRSVWNWSGTPIVIYETRHRRYEVFEVDGPVTTEEQAEACFLALQKASA